MLRATRLSTIGLVLLLVAAACSGGGEQKESQSSLTPVTRSIVGIIPAADIGKDGRPVDPGFTFLPGAPQVTIVAQAGQVTGSPMDLTWFQVTEGGEEELFTHTVEVASFEAAYSVGESPGTLLPGTYRVEATFEGETSSTKFAVQAPEAEASAASPQLDAASPQLDSASPQLGMGEGATGQGATSGPPVSGNSGSMPTLHEGGSLDGESYARWSLNGEDIDRDADFIALFFVAGKPGGGATVEAQATMGDITRTRSYPLTSQQPRVDDILFFNPCVHPGGSDLPGTAAEFSVSVIGPGDLVLAGGPSFTTLGPDETKPIVTIDSEPPNKSRVEEGDEIVLDATAQENREGPTWQEGLQSLKLIARPGGPVGEEQRSDSGSPQPCDRKQWSLTSQATYHVPDDAPPVIRICGEALDFAGNFSDPEACNEYYTGEVWEGTLTGHMVVSICSPSSVPVTGDIKIVVGDDGTLIGSSTRDAWVHTSCRFADGSLGPIPIPAQTFPISGRKTDEAFVIKDFGTLTISGTSATGTFTLPHGFGELTHTYTVDCVSCE